MFGRTWKKVRNMEEVKKYLIAIGGREEKGTGSELVRIRLPYSVFTFYNNGTIYSTPSDDPKLFDVWKKIDEIINGRFKKPSQDFLIGLDETGKGEVIGPIILTGVIFHKDDFEMIDYIIGTADTKKKHSLDYWNKLFNDLSKVKSIFYKFSEISPDEIDKNNINRLMDLKYRELITSLLEKVEIERTRIVIDDYGLGESLKAFLHSLKAEVIISTNSEDFYLETKLASVISKYIREIKIQELREKYIIEELNFGSGNLDDPTTKSWLEKWKKEKGEYPEIVRKSFLKNLKI